MDFELNKKSSNQLGNKFDDIPSFSEHIRKIQSDEAPRSPEKSREQEIRETFSEIDRMYGISNDDKFGLVGVVEGIKPAAEFYTYVAKTSVGEETEHIRNLLDKLGLAFIEKIYECEYDENLLEASYYVSKSKDLAREVKEQFERRADNNTGEVDKKLGQLFGFPETAIEWYVEQAKSSDYVDNVSGYGLYIHSPEYAKEEYEQYEARIMPAFEKYCPISAEEIKNPPS